MKNLKNKICLYASIPVWICMVLLLSGCEKFLDQKSDARLAIPSTLADLQALLDNQAVFINIAHAGVISSDNYYVTDSDWKSLSSDFHRRMYVWEKDGLFDRSAGDWRVNFDAVYYSNAVLEVLEKIGRTDINADVYDDIKGQAYFFRANALMNTVFIWCLAYDEATASTDLGLPLRMNTNFNEVSVRSNLQETYDQILVDFKKSIDLIPIKPVSYVRPSRPAAYAGLSRTYLSMRKYNESALYADSCLQLFNHLIDYNSLATSTDRFPFAELNVEVLTHLIGITGQILNPTRAKIPLELYNSFQEKDLRKQLFFVQNADGTHSFKGNYSASMYMYMGLASDEMYLNLAECQARQGKLSEAMQSLNTLLITRWETDEFIPFEAQDKEEALAIILQERRKQLMFRGLRWMDIKRLNKEGANITLTRTVDGVTYTLPPNDLRYALPIPDDVIELSGMKQNLR